MYKRKVYEKKEKRPKKRKEYINKYESGGIRTLKLLTILINLGKPKRNMEFIFVSFSKEE